jgi:flavin reductase (DIM6/NTAB) family NADH-FMN oxidoreductase RutF
VTGGTVESATFRHVLGHYPTGVVAVTAKGSDGELAGLTVGSFSSVSLTPPLVSFMAAHTSTSWPLVRAAGSFCANVLTGGQREVCIALARSGGTKFDGLDHRPARYSGAPMLEGAAAWIDCRITQVLPVGDHDIVVGEVLHLDLAGSEHHLNPLLFFRGGYCRLLPMEDSVV